MAFVSEPVGSRPISPPTFRAGERLSARKLNRFSEIERARRQYPAPIQTERHAVGDEVSAIAVFELDANLDDVITVRVPGAPVDERFHVAKPYLLRRSIYDGTLRSGVSLTYLSARTRTAVVGGESFTEYITPDYAAGDLIVCVKIATRVIVGVGDNAAPVDVAWLDLGNSRAWALEPITEA